MEKPRLNLSAFQQRRPQAGSGTRSFWLTAMGITEADVNKSPALGGCVRDTKISTGAQLQEHDGTVLTDPSFNPFTSTWDTSCDAGDTCYTNASYPTVFLRDVYNVFKRTSVTGLSADADLKKLFVGNASAVCSQTSIINLYGFLTNPNCGDTTGFASRTGKR